MLRDSENPVIDKALKEQVQYVRTLLENRLIQKITTKEVCDKVLLFEIPNVL